MRWRHRPSSKILFEEDMQKRMDLINHWLETGFDFGDVSFYCDCHMVRMPEKNSPVRTAMTYYKPEEKLQPYIAGRVKQKCAPHGKSGEIHGNPLFTTGNLRKSLEIRVCLGVLFAGI